LGHRKKVNQLKVVGRAKNRVWGKRGGEAEGEGEALAGWDFSWGGFSPYEGEQSEKP